MDYKKNYYDYMNYVKTLNRNKNDGNYYEKHHIIPLVGMILKII